MRRCDEFNDAMAADASGEIDADAQATLAAHLEHCPACSIAASRLRAAFGGLGAEPVPDPGLLYWASFGGRVRERIAATRAARRPLPLVLAAAALIAVIGLALAATIRWSGHMEGGPGNPAASPNVGGGPVARGDTRPGADAGEAVAEARFEAALQAMLGEEGAQAAGEIETILDDVAPGDPFALAGGLDEIDGRTDGGSGV